MENGNFILNCLRKTILCLQTHKTEFMFLELTKFNIVLNEVLVKTCSSAITEKYVKKFKSKNFLRLR